MKKLLIISASIGVILALTVTAVRFNTSLFKPITTNAVSNTAQSKFVNSREKIDALPIVKNKMLTANKNYTSLKGTIIDDNKETGIQSKINLLINQPDYFYVEYTPDITQPDKIQKAINNGNDIQVIDSKNTLKKLKPMKNMIKPKVIEDDTVYPDYNGTFLPISGANEMIHPEMYTQSIFRMGSLTQIGEEKFLSRMTTVIQVNSTELKVGNKQKFWIDNETGIILKTETYNDDKVLDTLAFENIDFSTNNDTSKFQLFEK